MNHRKKTAPAERAGAIDEVAPAKTNVTKLDAEQSSRDIDTSAWSIPPDYREGLEVFIGKHGGVVLIQSPICQEEQSIVLHPDEAERLLRILPNAIAAARASRTRGESNGRA